MRRPQHKHWSNPLVSGFGGGGAGAEAAGDSAGAARNVGTPGYMYLLLLPRAWPSPLLGRTQ